MHAADAAALIATALGSDEEPAVWADLGCGRGTFTVALASRLPPGSVIHAVDRDRRALQSLPAQVAGIGIQPIVGDFTSQPWAFPRPAGVLMANSLHYVEDQPGFLRRLAAHLQPRHRIVIVEYDTDNASRWVPFPLGRTRLQRLFEEAGYSSFEVVGTRPSRFRRADLYCAVAKADPGSASGVGPPHRRPVQSKSGVIEQG